MVAYVYCRVSTMEQALHGHSLDSQATACLQYCERHAFVLGSATNAGRAGVIVDGGKSAYKKSLVERPGGALLLTSIRPGDVIVVTSLSRLWRRVADMAVTVEQWVSQGVSVHFVDYPSLTTTTANGKAMLYVFAAMAQMKSELTSARVKEARRAAGSVAKAKVEKRAEAQPRPVVQLSKDVRDVLVKVATDRLTNRSQASGRTLAYVRVSTDDQSVEQQKHCIQAAAPDAEWFVDEGVSAFKVSLPNRPAGGELLRSIRPGDTIAVWRPDRMFRSIKDMAVQVDKIHKAGAFVHIIESNIRSDDPFGRMILAMLSILAEIESQECSRATKHAMITALATSEKARAARLPAMLREGQKTSKHVHLPGLTKEDRYNLWAQFYLTRVNYGSAKMAARVLSNTMLANRGLPYITGQAGEPVASYLGKLYRMQAEEFSERRQKVVAALQTAKPSALVLYPINPMTLSRAAKRQAEFFHAMRAIPGRYAEKQAQTSVAAAGCDPAALARLLELLDFGN